MRTPRAAVSISASDYSRWESFLIWATASNDPSGDRYRINDKDIGKLLIVSNGCIRPSVDIHILLWSDCLLSRQLILMNEGIISVFSTRKKKVRLVRWHLNSERIVHAIGSGILTHQRTPTRTIKRITPAVILKPINQSQCCDDRSTTGGICVSS